MASRCMMPSGQVAARRCANNTSLAAQPSRLAANLGAVIGFDFFATEEHGKHGQRQRRRAINRERLESKSAGMSQGWPQAIPPPAQIEPTRPTPVGAGRTSGRQPGNKPSAFERSVWAAPGWQPLVREFLRRRVAFSLVTFFWRSKRKSPAHSFATLRLLRSVSAESGR